MLCRNVLVYFTPEAARQICTHLAAALAPGGVLLLGTMDVDLPPPELRCAHRAARASGVLQASPRDRARPRSCRRSTGRIQPRGFRRRQPHRQSGRGRAAPASPGLDPARRYAKGRADPGGSRKAGTGLHSWYHGTRPAVHPQREAHAAIQLMREILRRAAALQPDQVLRAPEPLPVSFYQQSAQAFLEQQGSPR